MKRYGNLYEKIYNIDNLKLAHQNARRDKLFYKDVKMVDNNIDYFLLQIRDMLKNKTYQVSKYTKSIINDKGKERELCKLPYFPDRIIQWAILLQIENIFVNTMTNFTCASLKNRGIHKASDLVDKYMSDKEGTKYCLKIDIKKFYPNINHTILKQLLRKKFKDNDLLDLLDKIIDSTGDNKGIPIGSYLSQYFANFYLTYFDHWLREEKHMKYTVRYMDDVCIFNNSKEILHNLKNEMDKYIDKNLDLKIKDNWQVFPTNIRGIDFVGYRHFYGYKLLRKSTCKRYKRKLLDIKKRIGKGKEINYTDWCSVNSYNGWLSKCDTFRLKNKYYQPIQSDLDKYYNSKIKRK